MRQQVLWTLSFSICFETFFGKFSVRYKVPIFFEVTFSLDSRAEAFRDVCVSRLNWEKGMNKKYRKIKISRATHEAPLTFSWCAGDRECFSPMVGPAAFGACSAIQIEKFPRFFPVSRDVFLSFLFSFGRSRRDSGPREQQAGKGATFALLRPTI